MIFYNVDLYTKTVFQIPELIQIKEFIFDLGTHPVFMVSIITIVTFWLLKTRGICTWIMAGIMYLLVLKIFKMDVYMQHDFLIYAGLLMLLGMSFREAAAINNIKKETARIQDEVPVVTVVCFEEESAVTVPEKQEEKPAIFIPKSMEIPKRISKPKVEFAIEVAEEKMHYDVNIDDNADFDIK